MAVLSVQLKAEIKSLKKSLTLAKKEFKDYKTAADKANKPTKQDTGKPFTKAGKGAANATPALLEFNRTIQDAPFGIQGVANNIQQLTANFGDLSRKTGGSLGALKAMIGGLVGPQGVLLAVSAVTALMVAYSGKLKIASSLTKELTKATAEFVATAKAEINTVTSLIGIASNINNSYKVRQGALDELNKKYGDYLDNLTIEELNSDNARIAVDKLTASILQQAKVKGVQKLIEERLADSSEDLSEALIKQKFAQKAVEDEINSLNKAYGFGIDTTEGYGTAVRKAFEAINKIGGKKSGIGDRLAFAVNAYSGAKDKLKEISNEIETDLNPLNNILSSLKIGELLLGDDNLDNGVTVIGKKLSGKFKNTFKNLDDVFGIKDAVQKSLERTKPAFELFERTFDDFGNVIGIKMKSVADKVKPGLSDLEVLIRQFNEEIGEILSSGAINAFADFGFEIGKALGEGGNVLKAAGNSILSTLGGLLIRLGEMAIAVGVGIAGVKTALKTLNPVVAIAGGVALIAIGSAFAASAGKLGDSSGAVAGQGSTAQSSTGSSFVTGSGISATSGGRVVFEIKGTKLIGVLRNTLDNNSRLGGNLTFD